MATLTFSRPYIALRSDSFRLRRFLFGFAGPAQAVSADQTRDRMEFIEEMLARNREAFASDHDVQCMMHMFPDRF